MEQGNSVGSTLKAKLITVIWGERYIREFAAVSLPSYLADGNIPSLASACDFEVVVMTTEESMPAFDREPVFRRLQRDYKVRFIYIDDLVATGVYGVALTLAFARAVSDSGPEQTETYFIFMNSDFVLAEGSLKSLITRMQAGEPCIMAPSLRARAEAVLPTLTGRVDEHEHILSVAPRDLVRLTLNNLHATVVGKTVTQEFVSCATHNQIYWQVDEDTLLGRYFLIFMLAIKPERPMPPVNSYCDYGFVPELVPSGRFCVMADSDDFFMLELQAANQEKEFLHCGVRSVDQIAAELSRWTTEEHRRFAETEVVFHAGELPDDLPVKQRSFADFVERVRKSMSDSPVDHADHYYWVLGLQAWRELKKTAMEAERDEVTGAPKRLDGGAISLPLPPELRQDPLASTKEGEEEPGVARRRKAATLYLQTLKFLQKHRGVFPEVPIWHHLWLDSRLVLDWADEASRRGNRALLVHEEGSPFKPAIEKRLEAEAITIEQLLKGSTVRGSAYDSVLVHLRRENVKCGARVLDAVTDMVKPGGTVAVFIEHRNSERDYSNFSSDLARYIDEIFPSGWRAYRISAVFVGGYWKRKLRLAECAFLNSLLPASGKLRPLLLVPLLVVLSVTALLTAVNNFAMRKTRAICPVYCTSALLSLTKPRIAGVEATREACYREDDAPVPRALSAS